jgi:histidinol-phosphate aminotransferase
MPRADLAPSIDVLRSLVRDAVRNEKPYVVGGAPNAAVKLNQNESPFDLPATLREALMERIRAIPLNRYPSEQPDQLRAALARSLEVDPEAVIVGNGSNELTYTLGMTLLERGTPVVLPRPMFSLYEKVARLFEADLVQIAPRSDLGFDTDAVLAAVRDHEPVLTVITTPNNPTGRAVPMSEVEAIVEAARGFVVVDEAYVEFASETARSLLDRHPNVILMRTFSKAAGLAGLRVGYMVAHPDISREMMKSRLPFMVDRIAEAAALTVLEHPEMIEERVALLRSELSRMADEMAQLGGVEIVPSEANFVLFRPFAELPDLQSRLADAGVLVRDMSGYPELRGYVRVNVGTPDENRLFLTALKNALFASDS